MIEHLFYNVAAAGRPDYHPGVLPRNDPKIVPGTRNKNASSGVYCHMKRVSPTVLATLRTAFAVAIALVLILVLLPAMLAAQATSLR